MRDCSLVKKQRRRTDAGYAHASFDVSNSGNFDIQQPANFGDYTQMLGDVRRMQGSLRYEF